MLGIDQEYLSARSESTHRERRQQVRLARARVPEDSDVGVRISMRVEWIDRHRAAGRAIAANDQPARLLKVGVEPRQKRSERACVEHPLALQAVDADTLSCEKAVEHAKSARLEPAQDCAGT